MGPLAGFVESIEITDNCILGGAVDNQVDDLVRLVAVINPQEESVSRPATVGFGPVNGAFLPGKRGWRVDPEGKGKGGGCKVSGCTECNMII